MGADRLLTLLLVALTTLSLLVLHVSPAFAGRGNKPGGGTDSGGGGTTTEPSGTDGCAAFLGDTKNTTSLSRIRSVIGADLALDRMGLSGGGIGVAVIDTGINQVEGLTGKQKLVEGPDLSFDALDADLRHRDLHGHGTSMAAIISARGSESGHGVAPDSKLINVKVGAGDGAVDVSQVIAAVDWIVQNKDVSGNNIRVISLAYGTDSAQPYESSPLAHALENAWRAGIVVVVAGGNDGRGIHRLSNPAIDPFVIAVGAAQDTNGWQVPTWTSTGDGTRNPDLVAPGAGVLSAGVPGSYLAETYPNATCLDAGGDLYLRGSGTSQAAAVVAGAAALLIEQRPELTPDQVKYLLTRTARDLGKQAVQQGHGLLDLTAALAAPTPGPEAVQQHTPSTGLGTLEGSRGTAHVGDCTTGDCLDDEMTAFGEPWSPGIWTAASNARTAWTDQVYSKGGGVWDAGTWMGATWSGATWSGATWSGATWSGATWSGATWSGATWSGATWSGATWSGATWSGATWSGATWSGATWSGAVWS